MASLIAHMSLQDVKPHMPYLICHISNGGNGQEHFGAGFAAGKNSIWSSFLMFVAGA